jgi:hypothetical protein
MVFFFAMWRLWLSGLPQVTVQRGLRRLGLVALLVAGMATSGCSAGLRGPAVDAPTAGPLAGAIALGIRTAGGLRGLMISLLIELREEGADGRDRFALERARTIGLLDEPARITLFTFQPGGRPGEPERPPRTASALAATRQEDLTPALRLRSPGPARPHQRTAMALGAVERELIMR